MEQGYIKLWRKSLDSGLVSDHKTWALWSWCLMKATWKPRRVLFNGAIVELKPGQFIFGRESAARELKLSVQEIRTRIIKLKLLQNLTIQSTNKYSIITITNWDIYQAEGNENNQLTNQKSTSNQPATNHKQESKKERITNTPPPDDEDEEEITPKKVVKFWNEKMSDISRAVYTDSMAGHINARMRDIKKLQTLDAWDKLFDYCRKSDFLMGKVKQEGRRVFVLRLRWLVQPENMAKVVEGTYHRAL